MFSLLFSCEHGGNTVPQEYKWLFKQGGAALKSHRGYDIGAIDYAKIVSERLSAPLIYNETSRLLIDLNRSEGHPKLFSEYSKALPNEQKAELLKRHYIPYRDSVLMAIQKELSKGKEALHLSIHTFTPVLDGVHRDVDIGLLYDPARKMEKEICVKLRKLLSAVEDSLVIRFNSPYRGTSDGLTTYLRKKFGRERYAGIELEINQRFDSRNKRKITELIGDSVLRLISAKREA